MLPQSLLGLAILIIAIYVAFKLFKNIIKIAVVVLLFLLASYLIFGSIPFLQGGTEAEDGMQGDGIQIPPESRVKDIVVAAKNLAWGVEIVSTAWDSDGTLLIAVMNTGQLQLSGIQVWVNEEEVEVTNTAPESLSKGDTAIFDTNYMAKGPMTIKVKAGQAEDEITANP